MMTDRSKDNMLLRGERLTAIDDDLRELVKYLFFFFYQAAHWAFGQALGLERDEQRSRKGIQTT